MDVQTEKLLTVAEVSRRVRVSKWTVRTWLKSGRLDGFKVARKWRVSPEALRRFLDTKRNGN